MKIAFYIGDHAGDTLLTRAGWRITRLVQKGPLGEATHVEAIHAVHDDGTVTIASASIRDKGVRAKRVRLDPTHWRIVDVPSWDVALSIALLEETEGMLYDLRGAIATAFLGTQDDERYFCNEWVATPYLVAPATFGPHQLFAIALTLGTEETADFFAHLATLANAHVTLLGEALIEQLSLL